MKKENLKPRVKQNVNEVLRLVGLPPAKNKYDWCFGSFNKDCVLFQWYRNIEEKDGEIYFVDRTDDWIEENRGMVTTQELNRAYAVHNLLLNALRERRPIRIAIVDGPPKRGVKEPSRAKLRELDGELWWPHRVDPDTGRVVVVRGLESAELKEAHVQDEDGQTADANRDSPSTSDSQASPGSSGGTAAADDAGPVDSPDLEGEQLLEAYRRRVEEGTAATEAEEIRRRRIGQDLLRSAVLRGWGNQCALTGISNVAVLITSHIKPWRHSTDAERLDPSNALPLAATVDAAFDAGLLSFHNDGTIIVAPALSERDMALMGVSRQQRLRMALTPSHIGYLEWHRDHHGLSR